MGQSGRSIVSDVTVGDERGVQESTSRDDGVQLESTSRWQLDLTHSDVTGRVEPQTPAHYSRDDIFRPKMSQIVSVLDKSWDLKKMFLS